MKKGSVFLLCPYINSTNFRQTLYPAVTVRALHTIEVWLRSVYDTGQVTLKENTSFVCISVPFHVQMLNLASPMHPQQKT